MVGLVLNLALSLLAVMVTAYLIPGVEIESAWIGLILVVVISLINTFIKPILKILTFPINFLSLGLFSLILNGFLIMLADYFVDGFAVAGFMTATIFAAVLGLVNGVLGMFKD